jgi:hypothetical protein
MRRRTSGALLTVCYEGPEHPARPGDPNHEPRCRACSPRLGLRWKHPAGGHGHGQVDGDHGGLAPSNTAVSADYPAIPGADVFNSSAVNPDGSFDHGFFATKRARAMVIDYVNGTAAPGPSVATIAAQQYVKL